MSENEAAASPRVIVVDDDPLVLAMSRRILGRAGFTVAVFEDTHRALSDIKATRPFAVVADLNMPGMSGSDLLRLVAQISPTSWRILYTGEGSAEELASALAPGLTHAVVSKSEGTRLLPETLEQLRRTPQPAG
jgi:DNA-binding NtrC family response regulator